MPDSTTFTPWSSTRPFISGYPDWMGEEDQERIASYALYDQMYWNWDQAFRLVRRGSDTSPIYIPNPRKIVDTTSYYWLKGLEVKAEGSSEFSVWLDAFFAREKFYSRFETAKHSGVTRGDFVLHLTANPKKMVGTRISLVSVDPGAYFPIWDPDDVDNLLGVRLVEQWQDPEESSATRVKILQYTYVTVGSSRRVSREEAVWKMRGWDNPKEAVKLKTLIPPGLLPEDISTIPVYAFKNGDWQGQDFGNSELRGLERVAQGINQTISDAELALALDGLGVYATDAGRPHDEQGKETDWEVYPGVVLEVPGATMFKRVEGLTSLQPSLDLVDYLEKSLYQASGTSQVALGEVDVNLAESGIALAIKFIPTLAKVESRDTDGLAVLNNLFFDLKFWIKAYEGSDFTEVDVKPTLGDKLPVNRAKKLEELNNMLDRHVISRAFYRKEVASLGYVFPTNMEDEILEEEEKLTAIKPTASTELVPGPGGRLVGADDTLPSGNQSNNRTKVNESKGTEIAPSNKK